MLYHRDNFPAVRRRRQPLKRIILVLPRSTRSLTNIRLRPVHRLGQHLALRVGHIFKVFVFHLPEVCNQSIGAVLCNGPPCPRIHSMYIFCPACTFSISALQQRNLRIYKSEWDRPGIHISISLLIRLSDRRR